jgi:hypothetical protein
MAVSDLPRRIHDMDGLVEAARSRTGEIELDQQAVAYLYERSRYQTMPLSQWQAEVRLGNAIEQVLADEGRKRLFRRLVDNDIDNLRAQIGGGDGVIVLLFHGGFPSMTRSLLGSLLDDNLVLRAKGTGFGIRTDAGAALFTGRAHLLEGKPVTMGPDGGYGKITGSIDVLGAKCPVADGTPFLAHATGCRTLWFAAVRSDGGFSHQVVDGPRREEGERFAEYRSRFNAFYAERLNAWFSGDPRNLVLGSRWTKRFAAAAVAAAGDGQCALQIEPPMSHLSG